jgi:hypothetical protein
VRRQRRGEGQFICAEVGLRHDPKVLAMARSLRISAHAAVGFVMAWREFVLTRGTGSGVVRGYTLDDVAAFLEWGGKTARLVAALRAAGMLHTRRGVLSYPHWLETATGDYAHARAEAREADRRRKAEGRREQRDWTSGGSPADNRGTSGGSPADVHPESGDQSTKDVHRTAPPGPPVGGVDAAARLEWFEDNYPKGLVNRDLCAGILGALTPSDYDHLRHAVETKSRSIWWRERDRAPVPERFLTEQQWRRVKLPRRTARAAKPDEAARKAAELERQQLERQQAEAATQLFRQREAIRQRLISEGVGRHELEERIDAELQKGLQ